MFVSSQTPSCPRYLQARFNRSAPRGSFQRISAITCLDELQSSGRQIRLSFQLPYRCQFGQQLCIVGNTEPLGLWDVQKGLSMEWSSGDVWKADVQLQTQKKICLEYKYVVKNKDGSPAVWKPGENFCIDVPKSQLEVPQEWLRISDGWDGVQQVELEETQNFQDSAILEESKYEEEEEEIDISQLQPVSSALDIEGQPQVHQQQQQSQQQQQQSKQLEQKSIQIQTMEETVNRAFEELDIAIDRSISLLDNTDDVSGKECIQSDRMVATMAKRAITLQKALQTSKPPQHLLIDDNDN